MSAFGNLSGTEPEHKARAKQELENARKKFESAYEYLDSNNCGAAYEDVIAATFSMASAFAEARMGEREIADPELRRVFAVMGPAHTDLRDEFRNACVARGKGYQMPKSGILNGLRRRRRK